MPNFICIVRICPSLKQKVNHIEVFIDKCKP